MKEGTLWVIIVVLLMQYFCMSSGFHKQTEALNNIADAIQQQNQILGYNPMDENLNETKGNK